MRKPVWRSFFLTLLLLSLSVLVVGAATRDSEAPAGTFAVRLAPEAWAPVRLMAITASVELCGRAQVEDTAETGGAHHLANFRLTHLPSEQCSVANLDNPAGRRAGLHHRLHACNLHDRRNLGRGLEQSSYC